MKKLSISILEFVLSLPAHKLPAVFDLEQCPFPQGEIRLEEVLEEIIRLKSGGLIEANVLKGFDGKPTKVQIRYVTLKGRIYLEGVNPLASQRSAQKKILGAGLAAVLTIGLLLLVGVRHRKSDAVPASPLSDGDPCPDTRAHAGSHAHADGNPRNDARAHSITVSQTQGEAARAARSPLGDEERGGRFGRVRFSTARAAFHA